MSAQMYIARLIEEGRTDRGPNGPHRHTTRPKQRSWRPRKGHKD